MDDKLQYEFDQLLSIIQEQTAYKEFIEAKEKIQTSDIQTLLNDIEMAQKNSVHFNHYHKDKAYQQNEGHIDRLYQQLNTHDMVCQYRDSLYEANDLLHYITTTLEEGINKEDDYV